MANQWEMYNTHSRVMDLERADETKKRAWKDYLDAAPARDRKQLQIDIEDGQKIIVKSLDTAVNSYRQKIRDFLKGFTKNNDMVSVPKIPFNLESLKVNVLSSIGPFRRHDAGSAYVEQKYVPSKYGVYRATHNWEEWHPTQRTKEDYYWSKGIKNIFNYNEPRYSDDVWRLAVQQLEKFLDEKIAALPTAEIIIEEEKRRWQTNTKPQHNKTRKNWRTAGPEGKNFITRNGKRKNYRGYLNSILHNPEVHNPEDVLDGQQIKVLENTKSALLRKGVKPKTTRLTLGFKQKLFYPENAEFVDWGIWGSKIQDPRNTMKKNEKK